MIEISDIAVENMDLPTNKGIREDDAKIMFKTTPKINSKKISFKKSITKMSKKSNKMTVAFKSDASDHCPDQIS